MGIVGINRKGTQTPAGKMKFTFIFIGVMLLRGIELHRHMNRHGQKRHRTDPHAESKKDYAVGLNEEDELNHIDELDHLNKAVDMNSTLPIQHRYKQVLGPALVITVKMTVLKWHKTAK